MPLDPTSARTHLNAFDFKTLFIEELGWSKPTAREAVMFECQDTMFQRQQIATLGGVVVFEITAANGLIPDADTCKAVHKEVSTLFHENLLIFLDTARTQSLWYWAKREGTKLLPRRHSYFKGQPGDLFLSKISAMFVDIADLDEMGSVSVVQAAKRLQDALDVVTTTKKFYKEFETEHAKFLTLIDGIGDERDKKWYASVLLNRLMFIYFLQRKGFLDNGKRNYLQDKLALYAVADEGRYYDEFLKMLFFEGFAKPADKRTPEANALLGSIVYLNGGLFLEHQIEERWPDITIPDVAFHNLLGLFSRYSWNLDDTPGGKDDEINPDVLGYIFEKYINQKAFGAYYTRTEITGHLCEQTIHKIILNKINAAAIPGVAPARHFETIADLLMRLDAPLCRQLLTDILPRLSLLDPACGSGAFLVAAMKTLINIYSAVVGRAKFLNDNTLNAWIANAEQGGRSLAYFIKKRIITDNLFGVDIMEESTEIAKLRLFLALISSAQTVDQLEPLPNIDFNILAGNSLVGLLRVTDEDYKRHDKISSLFQQETYQDVLKRKNRMIALYRNNPAYQEDLRQQRDNIDAEKRKAQTTLNDILLDEFKGIKYEQATWDEAKNAAGKPTKRPVVLADVEALHPFHWGYEFDEVLNTRGGFDAIITNPPWEIFKPQAKEFFADHSELVTKNKMTIKEFEEKQMELLADAEIRKEWLKYQSRFPYVSAYYRTAKQYENQISVVNGKKAGTDINLYKLFTEQCFNLLCPGGLCGIVVPASIYSDLGAKQLRETLLSKTTITVLYGLSNEKFLFEGVHHAFKFCLLVFNKGSFTEKFTAAFRINPREAVSSQELDFFLNSPSNHLEISVALTRRLSPDSLSIMEFRSDTDITIAEKMLRFPLLGEVIADRWNVQFTREVNNITDMKYIEEQKLFGYKRLYEGKNIHQFENAFAEARFFIDTEKYNRENSPKLHNRFPSDYYRLCFRRQAPSTNSQTFVGTIAPKDSLFFDNLGYVRPFDSNGKKELIREVEVLFLLSCLNSLSLQFILRQQLNSNLSFFLLNQLPVPRLTESDPAFAPIVHAAARLICTTPEFDDLAQEAGLGSYANGATDPDERARLRAELDGRIAHLYGLTEDEFTHILKTFPLVAQPVKDAALDAYRALGPSPDDAEIVGLIKRGESAELEFKSSARWDLLANKKNKEMEQIIVKTVAAFLNSDGGTLLIGVADDGTPLGLAHDLQTLGEKKHLDGYELFLTDLLLNTYGKDVSAFLRITFHQVGGYDLCKVSIKPAPKPIWIETKDDRGQKVEKLYIKTNNNTRALNTREALEYAAHRWKSLG